MPESDAQRHRALCDAFETWLGLEAGAQTAFLERLRLDDAPLSAHLASLIAAEAAAGDFLEPGPSEEPADGRRSGSIPDPMIGRRLGSYLIDSVLGRGGMGTVYLARRDDAQFVQHVAIKVIRAGLDARAAAAFRRERQILAGLSHPYIAHLVDGGSTEGGDPYLVMEYVQGSPINRHCEDRGLTVQERLHLFLKVCEAVQFAHQHLIVHRDIKPANILVSDDGVPKLLDFGIARMMQAVGSAEPLSRTTPLLTPEYASPEQVSGLPVTTATDVFSLGVVLYEALSGVRPYRTRWPPDVYSVLDAIRHDEPVGPTRANAGHPSGLRPDGDLDAIVLKTLRKNPEERYGSVEQLLDDLKRFLEGRPTKARPPSRMQRARKFVGRHRASVAAAVVVALTLVTATTVSVRQARIAGAERRRAERRFDDVRQLANAFVFEFDQTLQALPGAMPARRMAISRGLDYLERLASDAGAGADAQLLRELASGYQRVAQVQGNPYLPNLGDVDAATTSSRRAIGLYERLLSLKDATDADRAGYASAVQDEGDLLWVKGDFARALASYRLALASNRALLDVRPDDPGRVHAVAKSEYSVGQACTKLGLFREALERYEHARDAYAAVPRAVQSRTDFGRMAAIATMKIGDGVSRLGDHGSARQQFERAAGLLIALDTPGSEQSSTLRTRAFLLLRLALEHIQLSEPERAQELARQALDIIEPFARADPGDRQARGDLGIFRSALGLATFRAGKPLEAVPILLSALQEFDALERAGSVAVDQRSEHGVAYRRAADVSRALGQLDVARTQYEAALARLDRAPRDLEYQDELALALMRTGELASGAEARNWFTRSLAAWTDAEAMGIRPSTLRPGGTAHLRGLLQ